jgi:hypothetical protein
MKHKLVPFYLLLLVVASFCQVAVKKEGIAACSAYSLNCLDAAKSTNQGLPIPYEFTSLTQSTNSTESPGQQALAIGRSVPLVICCCCTCIIGIAITIVVVACVGFSTVLAAFPPSVGCSWMWSMCWGRRRCNSRCSWGNFWRIKSSVVKILCVPFIQDNRFLLDRCISYNLIWRNMCKEEIQLVKKSCRFYS